jgi:hypothetical protein
MVIQQTTASAAGTNYEIDLARSRFGLWAPQKNQLIVRGVCDQVDRLLQDNPQRDVLISHIGCGIGELTWGIASEISRLIPTGIDRVKIIGYDINQLSIDYCWTGQMLVSRKIAGMVNFRCDDLRSREPASAQIIVADGLFRRYPMDARPALIEKIWSQLTPDGAFITGDEYIAHYGWFHEGHPDYARQVSLLFLYLQTIYAANSAGQESLWESESSNCARELFRDEQFYISQETLASLQEEILTYARTFMDTLAASGRERAIKIALQFYTRLKYHTKQGPDSSATGQGPHTYPWQLCEEQFKKTGFVVTGEYGLGQSSLGYSMVNVIRKL